MEIIMDIPAQSTIKIDKVTIAGHTFQINYIETDEAWGYLRFDDRIIEISTNCLVNPALLRDTLLHELFHAAIRICGFDFSVFKSEGDTEEGFVRGVENVYLPAVLELLSSFK